MTAPTRFQLPEIINPRLPQNQRDGEQAIMLLSHWGEMCHELLQQANEKNCWDMLTGAASRSHAMDILDTMCRGQAPVAVLFLDTDGFKEVNDGHGHRAGDTALQHLVGEFKKIMEQHGYRRKTDVVGRVGGDEFMIPLQNYANEDALTAFAETLRKGVADSVFMANGERIPLTVSIGVAIYQPGETTAAVIERADQALYKSKETKNAATIKLGGTFRRCTVENRDPAENPARSPAAILQGLVSSPAAVIPTLGLATS